MDENFGKKVVKGTTGKFIKQYFTIKCNMNNQVMDLKKDEKDNDILLFSGADSGRSQTFTFVRNGYDFYIKNKNQGKYLTLDSDENGTKVYAGPKEKGNKKQLFRLQRDESDVIFIRTFCDKVLEIASEGHGEKGHIIQWKFTGDKNQEWRLVEPRALDSSTDEGQNLYETKQGLMELKQQVK